MILGDRRLGKFLIHIHDINNNPDVVRQIMSMVIVVKADLISYRDAVEYHAISESFFVIQHGNTIPFYTVLITKNGDRCDISFVRERLV